MFKKNIFVFFIYMYIVAINAANSAENVAEYPTVQFDSAGNIAGPFAGNIIPTGKSLQNGAPHKQLMVKHTIFDYQINPEEFHHFLASYNLFQTMSLASSVNIVYIARYKDKEFEVLSHELNEKFFPKMKKTLKIGPSQVLCDINDEACYAGSSGWSNVPTNDAKGSKKIQAHSLDFFVKPYASDANINITLSTNNKYSYPEGFEFKSKAFLSKVKDKNYLVISQVEKDGVLYGQIILITFGK